MMEEEAVVARIEAGRVWVEKPRQSACSSCIQHCAASIVDEYLGKPLVYLEVSSHIDVCVGDRVVVAMREDVVLKSALSLYLLPLVALLGGALLGQAFAALWLPVRADMLSAAGGALGLFAAFALLKKYTRRLACNAWQPVVVRKIA